MAKLTIYSPEHYTRPDLSSQGYFLNKEATELSTGFWGEGFVITFHLPDKVAILYGTLHLTWEQAEQLKDDIKAGLKKFPPPTIK